MVRKATTLLFAISLGTFFGCGNSNIEFPTSDDPAHMTTPDTGDSGRATAPGDMRDAPKLSIPHITSSKTSVVVPITVENFFEIGCYDLLLRYNPEIMRATAVEVGPGVGYWGFLGNYLTPGEISISYIYFQPGYQGQSLSDGSVFLNITFEKVAQAVSDITFDHSHPLYNDSCDWAAEGLNDEPPANFYIQGSVEFE